VLDALDKWILFHRESTDLVEVCRSYGVDRASARENLGVPKQVSHNTLCPHRNLIGVWATNATATWTADELVLEDASGNQVAIASFNKTANIATSGAAGLDTGAEASSTWYYVWAIAKADGTQSILLSTASTVAGLTFPSGYTYAGRIGAVRNNGSSNLVAFDQRGEDVNVAETTLVSAGSATSPTSLASNLATAVPPNARRASGYCSIKDTGSSASAVTLQLASGSSTGQAVIQNPGGTAANLFGGFDLLLLTAQTAFYSVTAGTAQCSAYVTGYKF
jgi:hypothetical protein